MTEESHILLEVEMATVKHLRSRLAGKECKRKKLVYSPCMCLQYIRGYHEYIGGYYDKSLSVYIENPMY